MLVAVTAVFLVLISNSLAGVNADLASADLALADRSVTGVAGDTKTLPDQVAEAIAAAAAPLHPSLAESGRLNVEAAGTRHGIRDDTLGIKQSVRHRRVGAGHPGVAGRPDAGVAGIRTRTGEVRGHLRAVAEGSGGLAMAAAGLDASLAGTGRAVRLTSADVHRDAATLRAVGVHAANIEDSALLRLADLLLRRPDLRQAGDITAP